MDPFIGQIMLVGFNFAPRGWAFCDGQLFPIAQNSALFSLLGTTYGGNGTTHFALPDLRGRVPLGMGQGPGLTNRTIGEMSGVETVALAQSQMPTHTHSMGVSSQNATAPLGNGLVLARSIDANGDAVKSAVSTSADTLLSAQSIAPAGGNLPHQNMQPYTAMSYIIALEGIYPTRP
jgi:microcystin-dependent protein